MTEAIEVVYPQTLHQTCIVHLIRADIIRFSEGQSGRVQGAQAHIYQAVDADAAERALERFREALQKPLLPSRMEQKCSVQFFLTTPGGAVFLVHLGSPWNAALTFKKKSGRLPPRKKVALTPNFRQIQVTREEPRKKDERYDQYCRATFQISRSMARLPDHFFQDSNLARRWQEDSNS